MKLWAKPALIAASVTHYLAIIKTILKPTFLVIWDTTTPHHPPHPHTSHTHTQHWCIIKRVHFSLHPSPNITENPFIIHVPWTRSALQNTYRISACIVHALTNGGGASWGWVGASARGWRAINRAAPSLWRSTRISCITR